MPRVDVRPVGPHTLDDVRVLFDQERSTRHCWCMAFCTSSTRFSLGWYGGGNRRRFAALARDSDVPVGVLAYVDGHPAGWCSCGPRSRYLPAVAQRSRLLAARPRDEDDHVWLVACLFVGPGFRRDGLVIPLIKAAVDLAATSGATAVEAWPLASGVRRPEDEHVGRERVFARCGFAPIADPEAGRVIMRRDPQSSSA